MKRTSSEYTIGLENLLNALAHDMSINHILKIGYELLGNPMVLQDTARKVISINEHHDLEDDPSWGELAREGYTSQQSMKHYLNIGLTDKLSKSKKPFFWPSDSYIKYPRICSNIIYKDKPIGILVIAEKYRLFTDEDLELVSVLCNTISAAMQKNIFLQSTFGKSYESFLKDLLDGKMMNAAVVKLRSEALSFGIKKNILLLTINISDIDKSLILPNYLRKTLEAMVVDSKTLVYNGNVILLISSDKHRWFNSVLIEIENYLNENKLKAAISPVFTELSDICLYYAKSLQTLKLGLYLHPEKTIYMYNDYTIYSFIDICSNHISLNDVIHPAIKLLTNYDNKNNTNFLHTLYIFITNSRSIPAAADALHIHRNSMFYRMQKVQEITDININDNDILFHLELSFKIMNYNKSEHLCRFSEAVRFKNILN